MVALSLTYCCISLADAQGAPNRRTRPPSVCHSSPVQKSTASATHVPPSAQPQHWASEKLATSSTVGALEDKKPPKPQVSASDKLATPGDAVPWEDKPSVLDASCSVNSQFIPDPHVMEVKKDSQIAAEDTSVSNIFRFNPDGDLQLPEMCSQDSDTTDSFIMIPDTSSTYCDRLRTQSSPFIPRSSSPTQHRIGTSLSHPGHGGGSHTTDQQQHIPDVKAKLTWSPSATADTSGAPADSRVEAPSVSSSPSPELKPPAQSQNPSVAETSDTSIGPEHTTENVPSDVEAQSGVRMESQASQESTTPDKSSMPQIPLWEMAEKPAVLTSAGVSLSQQSQHHKSSLEKSVCVTSSGLDQHSDVVANSEPVTGVKGSSDPLSPRPPTAPPHLSSQQPSALASLALRHSPGPVHASATSPHLSSQQPPSASAMPPRSAVPVDSSAAPPHLSSQQPNFPASHTLPHSPGIVHSSATPEGPRLSRPDTIGGGPQDDVPPAPPVNAMAAPSNPDIDEGLPDSESVEHDSAARPTSQSAAAISAPFVQLQNSEAGSSAAKDQTNPSPSTNPTKEHSHLSSAANHPTQQSAPNVDSMSEGTSDDDDDVYSDVTYNSSTSASTTHNPTGEDSRNSSLHPSVHGMQPRTAPPLTMDHPLTSAVVTAGRSEMAPFVNTQAVVDQQSNITGNKQSQNTDQSAQVSMNSREQQLSNQPIQTPPAYANHPPSTYHTQPPATHPKPSVTVPSHIPPAVVGLPTSEVPSMMETSAETCQSAATVVEAADKADMTASLASSKSIEQLLAVTSGGGTFAASSALPKVHRQDSGYLGSNQFVSSSLSPRYTGHLEPHDGMPVDGYQRVQDSQGM